MKKVLLLVAVALAFTLAAAAQESGTQTSSTTQTTTTKTKKSNAAKKSYQEQKESAATEAKEAKTGKEAKAKEKTLTGCLSAGTEPDTYKLMEGKKSVTVTGEDLSQHVGHEVSLTGMYEKAAGAKKGREFKVVSTKHISDTCNAMQSAGKAKGKAKSKSKAPAAAAPPSSK